MRISCKTIRINCKTMRISCKTNRIRCTKTIFSTHHPMLFPWNPEQYCIGRKTVFSILELWGSGLNAAPPETETIQNSVGLRDICCPSRNRNNLEYCGAQGYMLPLLKQKNLEYCGAQGYMLPLLKQKQSRIVWGSGIYATPPETETIQNIVGLRVICCPT